MYCYHVQRSVRRSICRSVRRSVRRSFRNVLIDMKLKVLKHDSELEFGSSPQVHESFAMAEKTVFKWCVVKCVDVYGLMCVDMYNCERMCSGMYHCSGLSQIQHGEGRQIEECVSQRISELFHVVFRMRYCRVRTSDLRSALFAGAFCTYFGMGDLSRF